MRMQCKCGEILSNSMVPNDIELRVYTDREWDDIMNMGEIDSINIPHPRIDVWKCPNCERLYIFKSGSDKAIKIYNPEE